MEAVGDRVKEVDRRIEGRAELERQDREGKLDEQVVGLR